MSCKGSLCAFKLFSCIQTTKKVAEAIGFRKSTRVSAPAPLTAGCQVAVCPDPSMETAPEPRTAGGASWSWCHPDTKDMLEEHEPAETWCSCLSNPYNTILKSSLDPPGLDVGLK